MSRQLTLRLNLRDVLRFSNTVVNYGEGRLEMRGMSLRAAGRERWLVGVAALGASVNVAFNLVMIPAFGILGAASMTVITEVAIIVAFMWLGLSRRIFTPPRLPLVRLALGALVIAAVSLALERLPVEISFTAAVLAYGVAMSAAGVIRRGDIVMCSLCARGPHGRMATGPLPAPAYLEGQDGRARRDLALAHCGRRS